MAILFVGADEADSKLSNICSQVQNLILFPVYYIKILESEIVCTFCLEGSVIGISSAVEAIGEIASAD